MDLAYLLGQRPADSLKISRTDVKEGAVWVTQNKTGAKLRVAIEGQLEVVINRILARNATKKVTSLRLIPNTYEGFVKLLTLRVSKLLNSTQIWPRRSADSSSEIYKQKLERTRKNSKAWKPHRTNSATQRHL